MSSPAAVVTRPPSPLSVFMLSDAFITRIWKSICHISSFRSAWYFSAVLIRLDYSIDVGLIRSLKYLPNVAFSMQIRCLKRLRGYRGNRMQMGKLMEFICLFNEIRKGLGLRTRRFLHPLVSRRVYFAVFDVYTRVIAIFRTDPRFNC